MTIKQTESWIEEIGRPAFESIVQLCAALEVDYDRLEELRDKDELSDDERDEAKDLLDDAGECESTDDAQQRIHEDALSLRIFGERVDGEWSADRFELLLTTGGPAVRIVGDILDNGEPSDPRLEVSDWGKPWSEYRLTRSEEAVLQTYCEQFYFGE